MKLPLSARWRFVIGSLTLPAVFMAHGQPASLLLLPFICISSYLVGYRLWWKRLWPMMAALLLFSLLVPNGFLLATVPLPWGQKLLVTSGAPLKIIFLIELLLLSGYSIDKNIQLSGSWGRGLSQVLTIYNLLLQHSKSFSFKKPIKSLDLLLLEVDELVRQGDVKLATEPERQQLLPDKAPRRRWGSCLTEAPQPCAKMFYLAVLLVPCWFIVLAKWL